MRVIPFTVQIPDHERDESLGDRLESEADAVLSWVVEGWTDYRDRGGLDESDAVCVATSRYRSDADVVGRFIDAECDTGGAQSAAMTKVLYERFQRWAANEGCDEIARWRSAVRSPTRAIRWIKAAMSGCAAGSASITAKTKAQVDNHQSRKGRNSR